MDICAIIEKYFSEYAFCPVGDGEVVLLTKFPYLPYKDPGGEYFLIDAYYPAANRVYELTLALADDLNAAGIAAARYLKYGYKDLAVKSGLADCARRNTLAYGGQDGSRFVLGAIILNGAQCSGYFSRVMLVTGCPSKENSPAKKEISVGELLSGCAEKGTIYPLLVRRDDKRNKAEAAGCGLRAADCKTVSCETCGECARACPTGAIAETGFDRKKCLRQNMSDGAYPDAGAARAAGRRLWGCDICQSCCPANSAAAVGRPAELNEVLKIEG
jgi:hypothetical protein